MAHNVQVLLPLICVVLTEAQLHLPFFDIPGLPHPPRPNPDGFNRPPRKNIDNNDGYSPWFHHFDSNEHPIHSDSNERDTPFVHFDPFFHRDQGDSWDQMPGINNAFNIPNGGYHPHRHQPPRRDNNPEEKPRHDHDGGLNNQKPGEKTKEVIDKKPKEQDKNSKLNEANNLYIKTDSEILPSNTSETKKDNDQKDKDDKQVDINKKKDFLLVGQGNNANNVYLLHENTPNPTTIITPNTNQPGNNVIYIPYNPGQPNNPVYQVINGQLTPLPTNLQVSPDKIGVTGNNNPILNSGQSSMNMNSGSQNPGYVTIYSNGQLIQIPGVVVNSAPNNVPLQNGNAVQGTHYIIANTAPNNIQNVPAVQTPGTNVIYATLPNQASNGPIYVQIPNCITNGCSSGTVVQNPNTVNNAANTMSNNGLPSNVVSYQQNPNMAIQPNGVSNGYVQPNMVANQSPGAAVISIPNQDVVLSNQNVPYQPAVELPVSSSSNGYNQPMVSNQGQEQTVPNQGTILNNQNMPIQTAAQRPIGNGANGYNQPIVTSQKQEVNVPNQGSTMNNQNMPLQPAVEIPVNSGISGYNQPIVSNQEKGPNVPNQGAIVNNQNIPLQPAVEIPINTNGYNQPMVTNPSPILSVESRGEMPNNENMPSQPAVSVNTQSQPQVPNQGDQGTNGIVNTLSQVFNQPEKPLAPSASSLVLDSNNMSSLGAQPAIMISGLKDTSGDKKDKKKSKNKKDGKDKAKKEDKKAKDADKSKELEPFTNKKI